MIKLGLGRLMPNRPKSFPEETRQLSPAILQTLLETAAWCSSQAHKSEQLRSPELSPSAILEPHYSLPYDKGHFQIWVAAKRESYQRAIQAINETRSALVIKTSMELVPTALAQSRGKLLLYEPLETVTDGAAEASSGGFFDMEDAPPWDTWFLYAGGTIFSWVPETLFQKAQAGIDANPVDCIHWCTWSKLAGLSDVSS